MTDHDDHRAGRVLGPVEVEVELAGMRVGAELGGATTPPEAEDAARAILAGADPDTVLERAHRAVLQRHHHNPDRPNGGDDSEGEGDTGAGWS